MTRSVCLVGAGNIAAVHAEVLANMPNARLVAVVDPDAAAAAALAGRQGASAFASVEAALAAGGFDCAHVATPPDRHAVTATPFLAAGLPVFVEKPLAATVAEARALLAAADAGGAALGVDQNFVHHPAFVRLRAAVAGLGPLRALNIVYNMPLRQMASRQFGHWMFRRPLNLLLEQAVHPLSQAFALAGPAHEVAIVPEPAREIAPGVPFHAAAMVSLVCRVPVQMRFAVGQSFAFWQVSAICDDGVAVCDMTANRCFVHRRTRWLDPIDAAVSGAAVAADIADDSLRGIVGYARSLLGGRRRDPFFQSVAAAIADFHAALDAGRAPETDGVFGLRLVECCERLAARGLAAVAPRAAPAAGGGQPEIAVIGGTGFIGRHVVARLLASGRRVAVMARSIEMLPDLYASPAVTLVRGDARRPEDVARAIGGAPLVIDLAHGGGGGPAMLAAARAVADVCGRNAVQRLVHVGSIAALYLGDAGAVVTGATPPDPKAWRRAEYARAKAEIEAMLLDLHRRNGLPVCVLRPGLVVGDGTPPFHSGLGFYNAEQHCLGWNGGRNALPFVLVEDVAEAVVLALSAPAARGRCYNLVGDVRPSARAYVADLAEMLERPLRFHPQNVHRLWAIECGKWLVKRLGGRAAPPPSLRDLRSRGLAARFDTADVRRDLGWRPVADTATFRRAAIMVYRPAAAALEPAAPLRTAGAAE